MAYIIYSSAGVAKATATKLEYNGEYCGDRSLTISVESPTPIAFAVGDYVDFHSERFSIDSGVAVQKISSSQSYGGAFSYKDIVFQSVIAKLKAVQFCDYVLSGNDQHFNGLGAFSFYCTDYCHLIHRVMANVNRVYGNSAWHFKWNAGDAYTITWEDISVSTTHAIPDEDDYKSISISSGTDCYAALQLLRTYWDFTIIVKSQVVSGSVVNTAYISKYSLPLQGAQSSRHTYQYGKGNGLVSLEKVLNTDKPIITRLRAYGSTRNLPYRHYQNVTSMYMPKLMLPRIKDKVETGYWIKNGSEYTGDVYMKDETAENTYGIHEAEVTFDGSIEDYDEVYPRLENKKISDVENPTDNGVSETGEYDGTDYDTSATPIRINTYFYVWVDLDFNINDCINDSESPVISMIDGNCGGMQFEILKCETTESYNENAATNRYKLTLNRYRDESVNMVYPNSGAPAFQMSTNDKFVILGINMPTTYITAAELKLEEYAEDYLSKYNHPQYYYQPKVDNKFLAETYPTESTLLENILMEGYNLYFADTDLNGGDIHIKSLRISVNGDSIPQWDISLSDDVEDSAIDRLEKTSELYGEKLGEKKVIQSQTQYILSTSGSVPPSSLDDWQNTQPEQTSAKPYTWKRVKYLYDDSTKGLSKAELISVVTYSISFEKSQVAVDKNGNFKTSSGEANAKWNVLKRVDNITLNANTEVTCKMAWNTAGSQTSANYIGSLFTSYYGDSNTEYITGNRTTIGSPTNFIVYAYNGSKLLTSSILGITTDGSDGDSVTIINQSIQYAVSDSGTTVPTSRWQDNVPSASAGQYIWTRTIVYYSDDTTTTSYSVSRQGNNGTSVSIDTENTKTTYAVGNNGTTPPTTGWQDTIPSVPAGKYLWTKTYVSYTDGNSTTSYSSSYQGVDGGSAFVMDIDNEMTSVGVSSEGKTTKQETLSFGLSCSYGTTDILNDCTISLDGSAPTGFTISTATKSRPTITISSGTALSNTTELKFKAVHSTYGTRYAVFSIAAVKAGANGDDAVLQELLPSLSKISFAKGSDGKTLTPTSREFTCSIKKTEGASVTSQTISGSGLSVRYSYNSMPSSASEGSELSDSGLTILSSTDKTNLYIAAFNSSGIIIDKETIPIIKDGINGESVTIVGEPVYRYAINDSGTSYPTIESEWKENIPASQPGRFIWTRTTITYSDGTSSITYSVAYQGNNGSSAFIIDIDNEMTSIPTSSAGATESAISLSAKLSLYYGTSNVTAANSFSASIPTGIAGISYVYDESTKVVTATITINNGTLFNDKVNIEFVGTHSSYGTRNVVFTIAPIKAGANGAPATLQELVPSLSQISFIRNADGSLSPATRSLTCQVKKTIGANVSIQTITDSELSVRFSFDEMPTSASEGSEFNDNGISISSATSHPNVYIAAFNSGGTLIDRETIPIVKDGNNGSSITIVGSPKYAYAISTNGTTPPTGGWGSTIPTPEQGKYLWTRTTITYSDGTSSITYSVSYYSVDGVERNTAYAYIKYDTQPATPTGGTWTEQYPSSKIQNALIHYYNEDAEETNDVFLKATSPCVGDPVYDGNGNLIDEVSWCTGTGTDTQIKCRDLGNVVYERYDTEPDYDLEWSNEIPTGYEKLWMSYCTFKSDNNNGVWSTPTEAHDTETTDFEYSAVEGETQRGTPITMPDSWHDTPTANDIWMAVRIKENGNWRDWKISKTKGVTGATGETGANGLQGCVMRMWRYESTRQFHNDANGTDSDIRYIDLCVADDVGNMYAWKYGSTIFYTNTITPSKLENAPMRYANKNLYGYVYTYKLENNVLYINNSTYGTSKWFARYEGGDVAMTTGLRYFRPIIKTTSDTYAHYDTTTHRYYLINRDPYSYYVKSTGTVVDDKPSSGDYTIYNIKTAYWEEVTDCYYDLIIAQNAHIKFGTGNQLTITDDNNNVKAGISGLTSDSADPVRFWAGGEPYNDANTKFKVLNSGKVIATDGEFSGVVNATDGVFKGTVKADVLYQGASIRNLDGHTNTNVYSMSNATFLRKNSMPIQRISQYTSDGRGDVKPIEYHVLLPYAGTCQGKIFEFYAPTAIPVGGGVSGLWQPTLIKPLKPSPDIEVTEYNATTKIITAFEVNGTEYTGSFADGTAITEPSSYGLVHDFVFQDGVAYEVVDYTTEETTSWEDGAFVPFIEDGVNKFGIVLNHFAYANADDNFCYAKIVAGTYEYDGVVNYVWYILELRNCTTGDVEELEVGGSTTYVVYG